ncbi:MAG: MarR family transcriptional regulator [Rhodobacteraceae bacterium]|nr:MAG: MarR family transcriptional regulator [Paracoccaceae bacterium]
MNSRRELDLSIDVGDPPEPYRLDDQVGFLLRRAYQRNVAIFGEAMPEAITPTQFAAMARLNERGPCSQNLLGRLTAMDAATIKGVVDRLRDRGLVVTTPDPEDRRRTLIALSDEGLALIVRAEMAGAEVSRRTVAALTPRERETLMRLLRKIAE